MDALARKTDTEVGPITRLEFKNNSNITSL